MFICLYVKICTYLHINIYMAKLESFRGLLFARIEKVPSESLLCSLWVCPLERISWLPFAFAFATNGIHYGYHVAAKAKAKVEQRSVFVKSPFLSLRERRSWGVGQGPYSVRRKPLSCWNREQGARWLCKEPPAIEGESFARSKRSPS